VVDQVELRSDVFRTFQLTSQDFPALQQLWNNSADYVEAVYGRSPEPNEAQSVYEAGPEQGYGPQGKMFYGITATDGDRLIGVLDVFRNHPREGVWYIGLLLLSPDTRGSGIGRNVVETFAEAARTQGASEIQLNVVEQNESAHHFWIECGFTEVRRWRQSMGARESTFIRMRRQLNVQSHLKQLSVAVVEILSDPDYPEMVAGLKTKLATSSERFVWSVVGLDNRLVAPIPDNIKSAWIFVLRKDTLSGRHFHPNSTQHMVMIDGQGRFHVGEQAGQMVRFADASDPEDAWIVIDQNIEHEFFPQAQDMVVLSFHTCPADELVEIDAATGLPRMYEPSVRD
jgi:GNAT superfamily N-acetyltransferase